MVITGLGMDDDYVEIIEGAVTVKDDGTWESITVGINGGHEAASGTWSGDDNKLIELGGSYYLPQSDEAALFTKVTCPLLTISDSKEDANILRNIRDYRLQNSSGLKLVTMYYENAPEALSILSDDQLLKSDLKNLAMENLDAAWELLRGEIVAVKRKVSKMPLRFSIGLKRLPVQN